MKWNWAEESRRILHRGIDTEWKRYHAILSTKPAVFTVTSHFKQLSKALAPRCKKQLGLLIIVGLGDIKKKHIDILFFHIDNYWYIFLIYIFKLQGYMFSYYFIKFYKLVLKKGNLKWPMDRYLRWHGTITKTFQSYLDQKKQKRSQNLIQCVTMWSRSTFDSGSLLRLLITRLCLLICKELVKQFLKFCC